MDRKWFAEWWRYRELMYFLAWRDVKVRYKQAVLGAAWAILQPLANMLLFTLFFGELVGIQTDGIPYPLFTYGALVLWTYCSGVISQASNSLVSNSNLITKVYFPRVALPISSAVSGLLDCMIGLGFLVVLMGYYAAKGSYTIQTGWPILLAPVALVALILLTAGMSLLLAALNVRFRDIKYTTPFLLQSWLFITPVIYPITIIPERYRPLMALNPLTGIIEGFRASLFSDCPVDPALIAISLIVTLLIFLAGLIYFRRTERAFADVI